MKNSLPDFGRKIQTKCLPWGCMRIAAPPRHKRAAYIFASTRRNIHMTTNFFEGAVKTEEGLSFNGFILQPIADKCNGCQRIAEFEGEKYCKSYPQPAMKWVHGACNFATHVKAIVDKSGKVKINPLKASKRAAHGR